MKEVLLKYTLILIINLIVFVSIGFFLDKYFETEGFLIIVCLLLSIISLIIISYFVIKKNLVKLNNIKNDRTKNI